MSFIIEIWHEYAYACTLSGDELSGDMREAMLDCIKTGDCEEACRYVLEVYSPQFRVVKKVDGEYRNVLASTEDKREVCEAIYYDSESDFQDEDSADLYLVWEAASELTNHKPNNQ